MKQMIGLLVMMTISSTVYANTKLIKCTGPAGGQIARVEGKLQLRETSSGQMEAEGSLKINGEAVNVEGVYDVIRSGEYATLTPKEDSKITLIYINFEDSEDSAISYVEMDSMMHPLNCGERR